MMYSKPLTRPSEKTYENPLQYLTYRQAAALLQVSERKLSTMKRNGEIPHLKLGKSVRFSRAHLEQWLNDQLRGGNGSKTNEGQV
ncbi:helix-turn-helix domain-containing protein [Phycisphaerales bacterium AB-hyl4]|uniref:Helix-turn-helix domain-containing protein n=1 Tax=Natronomicrosphaera hydrolytica TaxID=3242702 RepID=A0ABV4UA11_9BACT